MTLGSTAHRTSLLDHIGAACTLEGYVVAASFLADGTLAAALGDGCIAFFDDDTDDLRPRAVQAHTGACLAMTIDVDGRALLTGGDDGRLVRTGPDGEGAELACFPGRWVEPVTVSPASGLRAAAAGRQVHLFSADGTPLAVFEHPSTVAGLAFDPKGRRLAAAHYGGASLWWVKAGAQTPRRLVCPGSHLQLAWSPDGKHLVSAMQENALHGWRLADGADMRMSGYPAKVKSLAWLLKGRQLVTGGAESVICWPFHGKDGPMGKAPNEFGWGFAGVATVVAAHPRHDVVAAGYEDGAVILVQLGRTETMVVKPPGQGAVTALAWSPDGRRLALGTEAGFIVRLALVDWRAGAVASAGA